MQQSIQKDYQTIKNHNQNIIKNSNHIQNSTNNQIFNIIFNRPKRYNAFSLDMYTHFTQLIQLANKKNDVKFIVVRGNGNNFSSGNDLNNFADPFLLNFNQQNVVHIIGRILRQLCDAIILSNKPIFAIIQGKAIGFAFTQLALYDGVFAVESSQFMAPLVRTAQGPEMCASYTYPKFFGKNITQKLLILGNKVSPIFLSKHQFLNVYKNLQTAEQALKHRLESLDELQWNSYIESRRLILEPERPILLQVNQKQIQNLQRRWMNPELPAIILQYMSKVKQKSKL